VTHLKDGTPVARSALHKPGPPLPGKRARTLHESTKSSAPTHTVREITQVR